MYGSSSWRRKWSSRETRPGGCPGSRRCLPQDHVCHAPPGPRPARAYVLPGVPSLNPHPSPGSRMRLSWRHVPRAGSVQRGVVLTWGGDAGPPVPRRVPLTGTVLTYSPLSRKAEEDRIRKEEEKARRELIKQEYLRRKQQQILEEQGLANPKSKPRKPRPKSVHREEPRGDAGTKCSSTREQAQGCGHRPWSPHPGGTAMRGRAGGVPGRLVPNTDTYMSDESVSCLRQLIT